MIVQTGIYSDEVCNYMLHIARCFGSKMSDMLKTRVIQKDCKVFRNFDGELCVDINNISKKWLNQYNFTSLLTDVLILNADPKIITIEITDEINNKFIIRKSLIKILKYWNLLNFSREALSNKFSKEELDEFFGFPKSQEEIDKNKKYQEEMLNLRHDFKIALDNLIAEKEKNLAELSNEHTIINQHLEKEKETIINEIRNNINL